MSRSTVALDGICSFCPAGTILVLEFGSNYRILLKLYHILIKFIIYLLFLQQIHSDVINSAAACVLQEEHFKQILLRLNTV